MFFTILFTLINKNLKLDKKNNKHIGIYYVGYITIKQFDEYKKINCVNPLYLLIYRIF